MSLPRNDLRTLARKAISRLLDPLAEFVIDAGLTAADVNALLREASVRSLANSQLQTFSRVNISGIAATTGIPRAEISRILGRKTADTKRQLDRQQQSTNRILAAWHNESRFTDAHGHPATLKLYGRGATFEALVKSYGRGIPPRALLDELVRSQVVDVLSGQRIRARAPVVIHPGLNPQFVKTLGDRAADLLSTMLSNMKEPESPLFVATVSSSTVAVRSLPLVRKELSTKSAEFLSDVQKTLASNCGKRGNELLGVTVFHHQASRSGSAGRSVKNRTNFRRRTATKTL